MASRTSFFFLRTWFYFYTLVWLRRERKVWDTFPTFIMFWRLLVKSWDGVDEVGTARGFITSLWCGNTTMAPVVLGDEGFWGECFASHCFCFWLEESLSANEFSERFVCGSIRQTCSAFQPFLIRPQLNVLFFKKFFSTHWRNRMLMKYPVEQKLHKLEKKRTIRFCQGARKLPKI